MYNATLRSTEGATLPLAREHSLDADLPIGTDPASDQKPGASFKLAELPDTIAADVLTRPAFLKEVHRERRRVDRSKAPLSIVVLRPEPRQGTGASGTELLSVLAGAKRETDLLGRLDRYRFAILLPDTDRRGVQAFVRKLAAKAADLPFSLATGTYPDHLFDAIDGGRKELAEFRSIFIEESAETPPGSYRLKRALDIVGALAGLVLASPLMIATALAVSVTSPGPVIFRQTRLGLHGKPFVFYKFRSMYCNNDDRIHREFVSSLINGEHEAINQGDGSNPSYKMKADPRITRVGSFIRKTSLDELPQLFSVLKGDMSLVGPRPALPYEVEKYKSWHLRRVLEVRPGITGLWQVEGRSRTTFDEMVRLDLRYVRSCSLGSDLSIIARTVRAVVRRDGAN